MTWLQYCGFKTSCPFKYKEYDLFKSIIIYLTKESFARLWYRDVSSFDECDWLCATLVLLCEWSGFLKQPLFGDEAGFSAAVIGAFLSSLSQGIVSSWFTMMKTFNFFTTGQSLILPMCASPRYCLCKVRHFPVLNLLRLQRKKKHTSVFCLICSFRKNCHKMGIRRIFFFGRLTWSYLVFACWSKWALSVLGRVHSVSHTASFPRLFPLENGRGGRPGKEVVSYKHARQTRLSLTGVIRWVMNFK